MKDETRRKLIRLLGGADRLMSKGNRNQGWNDTSVMYDEKKQKEAAQKITALGLSVRQAELLCKNMDKEPAAIKEPTLAVNYVSECEKALSKQLGRGVKIVNGKRKGRFELEFYGQEDLQILLDALMSLKK